MRRAAFLVLAPLALGCVALRPFAAVRSAVPAERFVEVGGQLVYVERQGSGEAVLLLHGFGASSYSWRRVLPGLAASFQALALDLNGFGWTERPRTPASYGRDGQMALVLGVMDALGIARAHLVGNSYGGALALWLAAEHPGRVRSLVLIDSAAPSYFDDRRSPLARWRPLNAFFLHRFALRPRTVRQGLERSFHDDALVTPELVAAYLERLTIEGIDDAYYGLGATAPPRLPPFDYRRVTAPTLVVWGAQDRVISVAAGRRASARIPGARFTAMPSTGHLPMEERPEELLRIVVPFLQGDRG
jgi:pimeloyl-ACP methyl ester carboxylesterase